MSLALELAGIFGISSGTYNPYNAATKKPYTGKNVGILEVAAIKLNGTDDPRWLTFLQAKELGYKVKKGVHGTQIEKWYYDDEITDKTEDGKITTKTKLRKRCYTVFHASQIDGIPALTTETK